MSTKTSEERLQELKVTLGDDLGEAVYWLDNAITNAYVELKIFHGLFVHSPKRVDVLNEASGLVAMYASKALWDSLCMALCRLTDPRRTAGHPNLCLESLAIHFDDHCRGEFNDTLAEAKEAATKFRERRNKVLAHADEGIALRIDALEGSSYIEAKNCLDKIAACMNVVHSKFLESTTMYDLAVLGPNDERAFLKRIYLGNRFEAENSDALKSALEARDFNEVERLRKLVEVPDWVLS
ncbi:hypothetical protein [Dinoroseobacter sp. S76]|uniref:AbiU2 domain-containing protein n=1 Tax=Dinoroseobacter sp. S76 TaxID=3415124 RepID=UPI003C7CCA0D